MSVETFNIGYKNADVYKEMLPPHYYGGTEDTDLVAELLEEIHGPADGRPRDLRALDLGCGPGRASWPLARYGSLHGADKSEGMIERFRSAFPAAEATVGDTERVVADLLAEGRAGSYDLVGSFWSLNYPLLECFEETSADGVVSVGDPEAGLVRARRIVDGLTRLLTADGHLVMLFFDADSAEQRLVTELWERIAPFPGTGRDYTWRIVEDVLLRAEREGRGTLDVRRLAGVAVAEDAAAAREWFRVGHLNTFPGLVDDPEVIARIDAFVAGHTAEDGRVMIPSGVRLVHFRAGAAAADHLPAAAE
ncbi:MULTISPECIES: class I SAM-dependent methyltransferase [Kitasatospora]|uniref:Putative methyltransferase n=1 Tax=Kitasatospora setae (strain ATCC 33774 / DSM 43861 / JCM 3304 / KCC A-0304 / NBRC 14216 / KM-6054) TaxID=452652 RepID=E4ND69_KITSK|nr:MULTISPECIES: class I SAM-dependent methyltransferase [Kitasatospora]BAJ29150.1 putative methyltransferase [Kitasatospora setae KM-6054]